MVKSKQLKLKNSYIVIVNCFNLIRNATIKYNVFPT